jgi:hypothetical protein
MSEDQFNTNLNRLKSKVITNEYLNGLYQELAGEYGEYRIGKQTLFLIVERAMESADIARALLEVVYHYETDFDPEVIERPEWLKNGIQLARSVLDEEA